MQKLPRGSAGRQPKELSTALSTRQFLGRDVPKGRHRSHARPRDSSPPASHSSPVSSRVASRRGPKHQIKTGPASRRPSSPRVPNPTFAPADAPRLPSRPIAALQGWGRATTYPYPSSLPAGRSRPGPRRGETHPPHPPAGRPPPAAPQPSAGPHTQLHPRLLRRQEVTPRRLPLPGSGPTLPPRAPPALLRCRRDCAGAAVAVAGTAAPRAGGSGLRRHGPSGAGGGLRRFGSA